MNALSHAHQERAFFYSPASFLHKYKTELSQGFLDDLAVAQQQDDLEVFGEGARLFVRHLKWDSQFFNIPTYKIIFADWDDSIIVPRDKLAQIIHALKLELSARHPHYYLFAEIPPEDLPMIQAIGFAGLRLVETKITYFNDLNRFSWPKRFAVRDATLEDIPHLRQVASESQNPFDRYHADTCFSGEIASEYLAVFAENSVKGFANAVLVPAVGHDLPGAFMTGDLMSDIGKLIGKDIARGTLSAISKERQGWYLRLLVEMFFYYKLQGVPLFYGSTQASNRGVIRVLEKLGSEYGKTSHVFSTFQ